MMKLYHGSYLKIATIDLAKSRPFKDFGRAFYLSANDNVGEQVALFKGGYISKERFMRKLKNMRGIPNTQLYYQSAGYVYSLLEEELGQQGEVRGG